MKNLCIFVFFPNLFVGDRPWIFLITYRIDLTIIYKMFEVESLNM